MYARINTASGTVEAQVGTYLPDGVGPYPAPPDAEPGIQYTPIDTPIDWTGRPSSTAVMRWNDGAPAWSETATLDQARALAWAAAKAARDEAEAAPFEFEGSMYDPNKENISGAALAALLAQLAGQDVADEWTLADNARKTLTGQQIIGLGLALTERVKAIHARGRVLRDLIDNAATPEEAFGYTWE